MQLRIIMAVLAIPMIGVANPDPAFYHCTTPKSCVDTLTAKYNPDPDDHLEYMQQQETMRAALITMDGETVAKAFADIFSGRSDILTSADRWDIATLPDTTRRALITTLLQGGTDKATLHAGQVLHWDDAKVISGWMIALPDTERIIISDRVKRLSRERLKPGPAGLSLLLEEPARSDALAHQIRGQYSFDAARSIHFLGHINPVRLEHLVTLILTNSDSTDRVLSHLAGIGYYYDTNYAWLSTVWKNTSLRDSVRAKALIHTLNIDNPSPLPWSTELETAIQNNDDGRNSWTAILSLYGNNALTLFEQQFAKYPLRRASLLRSVSQVEDLDADRLQPLVRIGLETRGDYQITMAALSVWRAYGLTELDDTAHDAVDAHPFDFVHNMFRSRGVLEADTIWPPRYGMRNVRVLSDYCEGGVPLDNSVRARDLARTIGIPDVQARAYGIDIAAVTAVHPHGDAWYVGYDRGEFGGGLLRYESDRTSETILDDNIQFILPVEPSRSDSSFWIMAGLNHMMAQGALHRVDGSRLDYVMRLPSEVQRVSRENSTYVLEFHDSKRDPDHWKNYHPPLRLHPDGRLEPGCPTQ